MRQINLLIIFAIVVVFSCQKDKIIEGDPSGNTPPNILLIIADDLGIEATPGYAIGSTKPHMPHLEKLVHEGITFDQVWAYPLCSPTRASILTGRFGYRTGVLNAETESTIPITETTLQTALDEATNLAYSHAIIGKWHLSNMEPTRPTDMGVGYYAGLLSGAVQDYFTWPLTQNGQTAQYSGYITTKITDLAIEWIGDQTKPWFCWVAYTAPHVPFHLPPDTLHTQGSLPTDQTSIDANPLPYFMAMIESIDHEMGRLMNHIPADQLENTIVIFIGDNGSPLQVLQSPYTTGQGKGSLYQGGLHVPMIIAGKGVTRKNQREAGLISSTDLFVTILELAGVTKPQSEDSYSFYPTLSLANAGKRSYLYSEILNASPNKSGFTVRDASYKWIQFDNGQEEFYNLIQDPYEQSDLLGGILTPDETAALMDLQQEAARIRQ